MEDREQKAASGAVKRVAYTTEEMRALALEDALTISDRFAREPIYASTGKGTYKGAGVKDLQADQAYLEALRKGDDDR
jgi:hypothetical protein